MLTLIAARIEYQFGMAGAALADVSRDMKEEEKNAPVCLGILCPSKVFTTLCIADINECVEYPGICGSNAVCVDTIGNYTCSCQDGYERDGQNCTSKEEEKMRGRN